VGYTVSVHCFGKKFAASHFRHWVKQLSIH